MTGSLERNVERHALAVDVLTAVALCVCALFGTQISTSESSPPQALWPVWIFAAVPCAAIPVSRRHPRAALSVTAAAAAALTGLGYLPSPLLLAPVMATLYRLVALTGPRTTGVFGSATVAVLVATSLAGETLGDDFVLRTAGTALWLMLPVALGGWSRSRRAYLESVKARAAHAERTREEEARLRVTEERMRIARELHDAVAHHMAVAHAQAGTAAHLADKHPEQTRRILADLVNTTSSALLELRATVGVLRHAADGSADPLEPAPGLDRLPALVAACESAGLTVTVTTEGQTRPLSPGVDLTAYRIVQEALTNAAKHAHDHAARVRLRYEGSHLFLAVVNEGPEGSGGPGPGRPGGSGGLDGPAAPAAPAGSGLPADGGAVAPAPGGGYGLMGMRERASSIGGDLHAGPRPEGGFEVAAVLPFQPHTPADTPAGRRPEEAR